MKTLIIKLGATGDVLRTTAILHVLEGEIHWLTSDQNMIMLKGNPKIKKCIPWNKNSNLLKSDYIRVINLEDSIEVAQLVSKIKYNELFGAYLDAAGKLTYTDNAKEWFDISIISKFGIEKADELKFKNRKTYQEMIFNGLGYHFKGEKYFIPGAIKTDLIGDIAIAPKSGSVWPMKNWIYFDKLKQLLEGEGYRVNYLPIRESLSEHIGDVQNHTYLIAGDSLPMHIALGSGIKCLSIFICTSPWEIYDYGLLKKIVSPLLDRYFYKRFHDPEAGESIKLEAVFYSVVEHLKTR